jgi:hypothetical protein
VVADTGVGAVARLGEVVADGAGRAAAAGGTPAPVVGTGG